MVDKPLLLVVGVLTVGGCHLRGGWLNPHVSSPLRQLCFAVRIAAGGAPSAGAGREVAAMLAMEIYQQLAIQIKPFF